MRRRAVMFTFLGNRHRGWGDREPDPRRQPDTRSADERAIRETDIEFSKVAAAKDLEPWVHFIAVIVGLAISIWWFVMLMNAVQQKKYGWLVAMILFYIFAAVPYRIFAFSRLKDPFLKEKRRIDELYRKYNQKQDWELQAILDTKSDNTYAGRATPLSNTSYRNEFDLAHNRIPISRRGGRQPRCGRRR